LTYIPPNPNGQANKENSAPVVLASDQDALPLSVGASTLSEQEAQTALIQSVVKAEDTPHVSGENGVVMLAIRSDSDIPTADDGDYTVLKLDEQGRLKVSTKPASYPDITGDITAIQATIGTPVVGGTVSGDVSRASNIMLFCRGTFSTINCTFEGSLESSGETNWFTVQVVRSNANTVETATGNLSAQPAYAWEASVNALKRFRVRCTARTSGTQSWVFVQGTYATEPIPATQVTGTQPVSGTVTATISGGQTASSSASTGNPLRIGGRIAPTAIASVDTTLVANDASEIAITTAMQQVTKRNSSSELDWSFPILPNITSTSIQSIFGASGSASVRNYIAQLSVQTDTLGSAGNMFILDNQGAIGTSVNTGTGVFTNSGSNDLRVGDCIIFTNLGTITGVVVNTMYYILATTLTATTFIVSATSGGPAVTITGSTSAFTFYRVFNMLRLNTTALTTPYVISPTEPWRGIANANLNVYFPTSLGSGAVYLNINGYRGF
jgi:hypothetical protein